jgi:hypothetical protein
MTGQYHFRNLILFMGAGRLQMLLAAGRHAGHVTVWQGSVCPDCIGPQGALAELQGSVFQRPFAHGAKPLSEVQLATIPGTASVSDGEWAMLYSSGFDGTVRTWHISRTGLDPVPVTPIAQRMFWGVGDLMGRATQYTNLQAWRDVRCWTTYDTLLLVGFNRSPREHILTTACCPAGFVLDSQRRPVPDLWDRIITRSSLAGNSADLESCRLARLGVSPRITCSLCFSSPKGLT